MKRTLFILALAGLLFSATNLMAQDYEEEERDVLELSFYSGLGVPMGGLTDWSDSLGAKSNILFGIDFGYFLTSDMVLGFNFTYAGYGIDGPVDLPNMKHRFYNPALYLKYYFWGEGDLVPYVKGSLGIDNAKFATGLVREDESVASARYRELSYDPALSFGLTAGVFYYTSDYSGLFLDATYHNGFTKDASKTYGGVEYKFDETASILEIHAGINVYFSGGQ